MAGIDHLIVFRTITTSCWRRTKISRSLSSVDKRKTRNSSINVEYNYSKMYQCMPSSSNMDREMRAGTYSLNGRFGTFSGVKWRQLRFLHGTGVNLAMMVLYHFSHQDMSAMHLSNDVPEHAFILQ
jgi:hypothetical protein